MKVYLSPSQQFRNIGVGSYGSEAKRCQAIADLTAKRLRAAGVPVKQTPRSWQGIEGNAWLGKVVAASNSFGADAHVAIHTNAGGGSADGTDAWHFPGSAKGKRLTQEIYKRVAPVSPGSDGGIHTNPVFYETRAARAPVCYIELAFHTNKADAASIVTQPQRYADAIADGILAYLGVKPKPAPKPKPQEPATKGVVDVPVPNVPSAKKPAWWGPMMRWVKKNRES
jgi:N-acetylmuramoyl-L-alanine amidase